MVKKRSRFLNQRAGASRVAATSARSSVPAARYRWLALPLVLVGLGFLLPSALVAVPELPEGPLFPLRKIEVIGELQRLDPEQLRSRLLPSASVGFFDVDVLQLRQRVSDLPWVAGVQINRRWPDQLVITITERRPVARWRSDGLLDSQGKLFIVDSLLEFASLPLLTGPVGSEQQVFAGFQFLRSSLVQLPQPINEVDLDSRGVWRLRTIDGVLLTFRGHPQVAPLARLLQVYRTQLIPHWDKVRRVDMRYGDGLAVAFAPESVKVEEGSRR